MGEEQRHRALGHEFCRVTPQHAHLDQSRPQDPGGSQVHIAPHDPRPAHVDRLLLGAQHELPDVLLLVSGIGAHDHRAGHIAGVTAELRPGVDEQQVAGFHRPGRRPQGIVARIDVVQVRPMRARGHDAVVGHPGCSRSEELCLHADLDLALGHACRGVCVHPVESGCARGSGATDVVKLGFVLGHALQRNRSAQSQDGRFRRCIGLFVSRAVRRLCGLPVAGGRVGLSLLGRSRQRLGHLSTGAQLDDGAIASLRQPVAQLVQRSAHGCRRLLPHEPFGREAGPEELPFAGRGIEGQRRARRSHRREICDVRMRQEGEMLICPRPASGLSRPQEHHLIGQLPALRHSRSPLGQRFVSRLHAAHPNAADAPCPRDL